MTYIFCIGAQKAGTTYLNNLLKQHSEICGARYKETHFFSRDSEYNRGIEHFLSFFTPDDNTKYLMDVTPEYFPKKIALERIHKHFPDDVKIIVMLRDPVKRAFSQYKMMKSNGKAKKSFIEMVSEEIKLPVSYKRILGRGFYAEQLDTVYEIFNQDQVFIGCLDELSKDKEKFLERLFDFIGLDLELIDYDVFMNKEKTTKVTVFRQFFYKIPLSYRRNFRALGKLPEKIAKWIFDSSYRVPFEPPVIEEEAVEILSAYYRKANEVLYKKYNINTEEWL